jgi:uncharacterized membrane protein
MNRLELIIGVVLRVGVTASSICLAAGLVLALAGVAPVPAALLLTIGVVVLLMTPVARVIVSVVEYARERDWVFMTLTLVVLLELLGSLVAARYGSKL